MHVVLVAVLSLGSMLSGIAGPTVAEVAALRVAARNQTAYTLPPEKLVKATALHRIEETLTLSDTVWTPVQLMLILALGWSARYRDMARRVSGKRWIQTPVYLMLLLVTIRLLDLPIGIYGHHVAVRYGLSLQGWGSWLEDKGKGLVLEWVLATLVAMGVLRAIRRAPGRWWLWAWPPAVLFTLAGVLITPYVIDPLFNRFEPLAQTDPALVQQLEQVVQRSGIGIPPERMFLMRASAKVTGLNAYVTGFGPSKRIVVWDTTVAHSTRPEIAFIFAHELGHYALEHVVLGILLSCAGLLPLFWLTHVGARALLRRWGVSWGAEAMDDLAAIPVLLLVLAVLSSVGEPLGNAVSRRMEHNADVYGQEAVHTILPEDTIQALGRQSFQTLGETSLDDPAPHPVFDLWFGTHPPIRERAAFAEAYDPWVAGAAPKYFAR
ncbi:MAG: M48 family metallopeptidase [Acidobacteriaceae bacterium]